MHCYDDKTHFDTNSFHRCFGFFDSVALATSRGCEVDYLQLVCPDTPSASGAKFSLANATVTNLVSGTSAATSRSQARAVMEGKSAPPLPGKFELRYCFKNNKYQVRGGIQPQNNRAPSQHIHQQLNSVYKTNRLFHLITNQVPCLSPPSGDADFGSSRTDDERGGDLVVLRRVGARAHICGQRPLRHPSGSRHHGRQVVRPEPFLVVFFRIFCSFLLFDRRIPC